MVICSLGFSEVRDQPLRVKVFGAPPFALPRLQRAVIVFHIQVHQMCGLPHSIFVTAPTSVTGLFASNSAANEWCADTAVVATIAQECSETGVGGVHAPSFTPEPAGRAERIPNPDILREWRSQSPGPAARRFSFSLPAASASVRRPWITGNPKSPESAKSSAPSI